MLAKEAGCTHRTVTNTLRGTNFPRFTTVDKIYRATGGKAVLLALLERTPGTATLPIICMAKDERQGVRPWLQKIRQRSGPSLQKIALELGITPREASNFLGADDSAGVGSIQSYVSAIAGLKTEYCCVLGLVDAEN